MESAAFHCWQFKTHHSTVSRKAKHHRSVFFFFLLYKSFFFCKPNTSYAFTHTHPPLLNAFIHFACTGKYPHGRTSFKVLAFRSTYPETVIFCMRRMIPPLACSVWRRLAKSPGWHWTCLNCCLLTEAHVFLFNWIHYSSPLSVLSFR